MKFWFSIIFSSLLLLCSSQSTLLWVDYSMNQNFYELHCENKSKPQLECHGKCQMSKNEQVPANSQLLKICSDFIFLNSIPDAISLQIEKSFIQKEKINFICDFYQSPTAKLLEEPPIVG